MHLYDLTLAPALSPSRPDSGVPEWTLGCFRRRCITYFTGAEDAETVVIWMQSRGLTADFRFRPTGVRAPSAAALEALPVEQVLGLLNVEGGLAQTRWDGRLMHWSGWTSFQTHAKWPEPGRLERVGNSLIEFAPSGAYVEDWRFQPPGPGPFIGLSLLEERDALSGEVLHRGGGLIICGGHAAFVRGRPEALPTDGRLTDYLRAHADDPATLRRVFGFDASYGTAADGQADFRVRLSTLPWREGEPLLSLDGFSIDAESGLMLQRVEEHGRHIERRFTIDTLEPELGVSSATVATLDAAEWLRREQDTLLATVR